ncbi:serine protease snake-like isoform X1 [Helicoverpa zea]|uniref:serine protease snake-like isoform X1 n=1 Tax=Helicoverpa zea TaxID=7113 RepID=UPI001F5AE828|nr:serine protease snake-like isoform X1 [Helicoverpa zea]
MLFMFIIVLCLCLSFSDQNGQVLNRPEGSQCSINGKDGKCTSIRNCKSAKQGLQRKIHPTICSFEGKIPIVCCKECEQRQSKRIPVYQDIGSRFNDSDSKARNICLRYLANLRYPCIPAPRYLEDDEIQSDTDCDPQPQYDSYDVPSVPQVVGGHAAGPRQYTHMNFGPSFSTPQVSNGYMATRRQYTHMALLGYGEDLETAQWLCGGSVISERYILTAAHCISSPSLGPVRFVALGILKRSDPDYLWQKYYVKRVVPHPEYQSPSKYHDIALLETDTRINFDGSVLPACLHSEPNPAAAAEASGWGALGHRQGLADNLQAVKLKRYDEETCSQLYPAHRHLVYGFNHTTQMCYGDDTDPKDTCEGDSGGPLQIANDVLSCAYDIIGVTSYGRQCGVTAGSGIYTRVYHYLPWIESIVWP